MPDPAPAAPRPIASGGTLHNLLLRRLAALGEDACDLKTWRLSLLNGLCAATCCLGLLVGFPSVWFSIMYQLWGLVAADILALAIVMVLHFRRNIDYRYRAAAFLATAYLIAVSLLFAVGTMTQIYLMAVPVLCTMLMGRRAAMLAIVGCGATLFLAGYYGGIPQGTPTDTATPLLHWTVLSTNFMLVASLLVVSCTYLLHGLQAALERQRAVHEKLEAQIAMLQARETALRESVAAQKAAEESNEQKSEFLAMISHEVRTPLGGVIGMLRLAKKDATLSPDTRNKLRISLGNAEVLLHIINDILDFSRLEAGKMPFEHIDFDLPALLADVVALLADRAETKGISLVCDIDGALPRWWRGDPVRLRQVVMNLVGNGVKFTERGEVRLTARLAADGQVVLAVSDTGIGIEPGATSRLFGRFEQGNAATARKYGGTGLGLAICKNIVDVMGGVIDVRSKPDAGSVFKVVLPMEGGQPAAMPALEKPSPHASRLEILCAEDGSTNQIILRELLSGMGHGVTIAEDGAVALEKLAQRDFDLVIMDSRMPRLDGIAALGLLRAGAHGVRRPTVPVIALTANAAAEERQRFLAAGANGFLPKPIDEASLHAEIGRLAGFLAPPPAAALGGVPALSDLDAMFGTVHAFPPQAPLRMASPAARAAFRLEGPRQVAAIMQGVADGDMAAISLNAHNLQGSAGLFGARELSALCGRIELAANQGAHRQLQPLAAELEARLAALLASLAA